MTRAEEVWFEIAKLLDTEKDEKRFVAIIAAALAESRAHGVREARALVVSELRSLPGFWTLPWDLEKLIEKHFDLLSSAPEQPNAVERQAMAGVYGFAPEVPDKLAGLRERIRSALAQLQDIHWPEGKECSKDCRVCRAEEELIAALEATPVTAAGWRKSIKARGWEIEALLRDFEAAEADNAILRTAQKSVLSSRDAWKAQAEGLKTVQQDIIDGALHDVSERCVAAEAEAQAEAQRREAAEARVKEFEAFVRRADAQQSKALEMLRKVGYVYNNPEDMMQKLAFSLYTYLVEISQWARAELDDVAPAPQERGGEGA